jgi:hypothetical protein
MILRRDDIRVDGLLWDFARGNGITLQLQGIAILRIYEDIPASQMSIVCVKKNYV